MSVDQVERLRALCFLVSCPSPFIETVDPAGFRALCAEGLLTERSHPTRYRFQVTEKGAAARREAHREAAR